MSRSLTSYGTFAPLETEDSRRSDHRGAYCTVTLKRKEAFQWESYSYQHRSAKAEEDFKAWIVMHDWNEVITAEGSNRITNKHQNTLSWAIEMFFPLKTTRKTSTDLPWLNKRILKLITNRKRLFVSEEGQRTDTWKAEKKRIDGIIRERKRRYMDTQRGHLFFQACKELCII